MKTYENTISMLLKSQNFIEHIDIKMMMSYLTKVIQHRCLSECIESQGETHIKRQKKGGKVF